MVAANILTNLVDSETPVSHYSTKGFSTLAAANGSTDPRCVKGYFYSMSGHAQKSVEHYCELSGMTESELKVVSTPTIDDHLKAAEKFATKGVLAEVCSRIVLKISYFARISRLDLLSAVNMLAREVTRWTKACDDRLLRLVSYINCTKTNCTSTICL